MLNPDGVTLRTTTYTWGVVRHIETGSDYHIVLHPPDYEAIKKLWAKGPRPTSVKFTDESGYGYTVKMMNAGNRTLIVFESASGRVTRIHSYEWEKAFPSYPDALEACRPFDEMDWAGFSGVISTDDAEPVIVDRVPVVSEYEGWTNLNAIIIASQTTMHVYCFSGNDDEPCVQYRRPGLTDVEQTTRLLKLIKLPISFNRLLDLGFETF